MSGHQQQVGSQGDPWRAVRLEVKEPVQIPGSPPPTAAACLGGQPGGGFCLLPPRTAARPTRGERRRASRQPRANRCAPCCSAAKARARGKRRRGGVAEGGRRRARWAVRPSLPGTRGAPWLFLHCRLQMRAGASGRPRLRGRELAPARPGSA